RHRRRLTFSPALAAALRPGGRADPPAGPRRPAVSRRPRRRTSPHRDFRDKIGMGVNKGGFVILKTYSTKDAPYVAKAAYWNELIHKFVAPVDITPVEQLRFDAQVLMDSIGPLSLRRTSSMPAMIEAREEHISKLAEQRFFLMMPLQGSVSMAHCGRQCILEPGDFVLIDGAAPARMEFNEPNISLHLVLSPADLKNRVPTPENLCGLKTSRDKQFGSVVGAMLQDVWRQIEQGFPQEHGLTIAKNLLDVVATAYALQHGTKFAESGSMSARRAHIKRFIEARLRDPNLSAASVADYFG